MKTPKLILALSLTAGLAVAPAAPSYYTSSAAFFAALAVGPYGPALTETYESYAPNTEILVGQMLNGYTYSSFATYLPEGVYTGRVDSGPDVSVGGPDYSGFLSVGGGTQSLAGFFNPLSGTPNKDFFLPDNNDDAGSFTVGLPVGTQAIGIFFNTSSMSTPGSTDLYINTPVGTATNGGSNFDTTQLDSLGGNNLFFVGLISTDMPFITATIGTAIGSNTGWSVDNLTTATPEPTSIFLLSFGVAGLVGYSRRRGNR